MENYRHDGVNITAFQLVNPTNPLVEEVVGDWVIQQLTNDKSPLGDYSGITVSRRNGEGGGGGVRKNILACVAQADYLQVSYYLNEL